MRAIAPQGPVYQAGTLSGNPLAMTAGLATLECLTTPDFYTKLANHTTTLIQGFITRARAYHLPLHAVSIGSLFGLFFTTQDVIETEKEVLACDKTLFRRFFHGMLDRGVYLAPSAYEVGFVSAAHGTKEIDNTLSAAEKVFEALQKKG